VSTPKRAVTVMYYGKTLSDDKSETKHIKSARIKMEDARLYSFFWFCSAIYNSTLKKFIMD